MDFLEAAATVLSQEGHPLGYRTIIERALDQQLVQTTGKTPWATMNARLSVDIKTKGNESAFVRTAPGIFALRSWNLPELHASAKPPRAKSTDALREKPIAAKDDKPNNGLMPLTFSDAAERVLEQLANRIPMHYVQIVKLAQEHGWLTSEGKTPEATLVAVIGQENARRTARGEEPRFVSYGNGLYGLAIWQGKGLSHEIEQMNERVRSELHNRLFTVHPKEFEGLVGRLLVRLGFDKVEITSYHKDGGIDVRGELVVGDVIRTTMAVQVKRWKSNVQTPAIQQLRGSLGTHEQGLIITTSDFSEGAREEASRPNAVPVALMNGNELVGLLVEFGIGVHKETRELLELAMDDQEGKAEHEGAAAN